MSKFVNRYGDEFTFEENDNGNIEWKGNFKWCRTGMPNDYSKAWEYFNEVYGGLSFEDFKKDVHSYDEEKEAYVFPDVITLITSKTDEINMVDPSGGPYLTSGMKLMEKTIKEFKYTENGYLIITE
tara:strand:+ start:177 stop:554 length:378 start_codon:yes stop_codon:yes gene_type:complete